MVSEQLPRIMKREAVGGHRGVRAGSLYRRARAEGVGGVVRRVARRVYDQVGAAALDFPLLAEDIADSQRGQLPAAERRRQRGEKLTVGWLCTPPRLGSGGHTTMFRMVEGLEAAGHSCVILLHDRHFGDLEQQAATIRRGWPSITADVARVGSDFGGLDAVFATGWETAHVLAVRSATPETAVHRLYFAQDFEPFFYPRGGDYALAEDSYRLGLRIVALGHMVQDVIQDEVGVASDFAPFGCDTGVYSLENGGPRNGVVMYTKPGVPRRGYLLGKLALEEFHRRHPEQELHVYGEPVRDWHVPVTQHERLSPAELNALYNRTVAGLALSFTNISLVAEEMLAAGTIPIVNDSHYSRADLSSDHVVFAQPTPHGLAEALCAAVEGSDISARAKEAAASVSRGQWGPAQHVVRAVLEDEVYRATS